MAKRGENIRKRKDGRWEGRFIIIFSPLYPITSDTLEKIKHFSFQNHIQKSCTLMSPTKTELVTTTGAVNTPRKKKVRVQK